MPLRFGKVGSYSSRGFGYLDGYRSDERFGRVFFHITKIRQKHPALAEQLESLCTRAGGLYESAWNTRVEESETSIYLWYTFDYFDRGPAVLDIRLHAHEVPVEFWPDLAPSLDSLWSENSMWDSGASDLPQELHAFTKQVLGHSAYLDLVARREAYLRPIRERLAENERLAREREQEEAEVHREEMAGLRDIETQVVGVVYGNRQSVISKLTQGEQVWLRREPKNRYDANAIRVERTDGQQIGYISRDEAAQMAPALDSHGQRVAAEVVEIAAGLGE